MSLIRHHLAIFITLVLLSPSLIASGGGGGFGGGGGGGGSSRSGGGYRGGGSRTQVDQAYQLGQQVYQNRVKLGSFNAKSFEAQIRGLEEAATWASGENNQRAPNFYQLAGHLSDKQYDGLRRYLEKRHEFVMAERKSDPDYAFAVRWLLQPGAAYETSEIKPAARKKSTSRKSKDAEAAAEAAKPTAQELQNQARQLYVMHQLTDNLPEIRRGYGGKNAVQYDTDAFTAMATKLSNQQLTALQHYAQQRFKLTIKALSAEEAKTPTNEPPT